MSAKAPTLSLDTPYRVGNCVAGYLLALKGAAHYRTPEALMRDAFAVVGYPSVELSNPVVVNVLARCKALLTGAR